MHPYSLGREKYMHPRLPPIGGGSKWHRPTCLLQKRSCTAFKPRKKDKGAPPLLVHLLSREKVHRPFSAPWLTARLAGQFLKVQYYSLGQRNDPRCPERILCAIIEIGKAETPRPNHQFSHRGPHFWCTIAEWWWHHIPFAQRFFVHSQFS